ncbi:MAG: class I SAM-dependent methyltransferase [Litorimonas sp.]
MANATTFGRQAAKYARGRPGYPPELYQWIADNSPAHNQVWDIGTGSGQAAKSLADYFKAVHATDISKAQIAAAILHPKIFYHTAPAHMSGLEAHSVDCMTVATALHWFSDSVFWDEIKRVATKNAFFCAWTYQLPECETEVHTDFLDPLFALIDPYWADGNRICMAGYSAEVLNCPFPTIAPPAFDAGGLWTAQQLVDFAESWSAHFRAREDGLTEDLNALSAKFMTNMRDKAIKFSLPISVLAARIP